MDLYHIPNDNGVDYRLNKFIEYQRKYRPVHVPYLVNYALTEKISRDEAVLMAYIHSLTYCEVTTVFIFENIRSDTSLNNVTNFYNEHGDNLIYNSARHWVKDSNTFMCQLECFYKLFKRGFEKTLLELQTSDPEQSYTNMRDYVGNIKHTGRFAQDLFMELVRAFSIAGVLDFKLKVPFELEWEKDANMTSCIYNLFYEDEKANHFDKYRTVSKEDETWLYEKLAIIQEKIHETYPEDDYELIDFMTKLCSFRNLFKKARYGGFHHDRQLEVIIKYMTLYNKKKDFNYIWDKCFELRVISYDDYLLGEHHGWCGIRKERKKYWIEKGII